MTTDHELLSGIIADMRKLAEANDKLYLFELEDFADRLQSLLGECERCKQYDELILAVSRKYPDETRHETALKYIRRAESTESTLCAASTLKPTGEL